MGINQDAYDLWQEIGADEKDYNATSEIKQSFLNLLAKVNAKFGMLVPTKKDLHNGFLREFHELNPTTQVAIKEYIFGMSDSKYRKYVVDHPLSQVICN